jgi:5'-nucleotidase
VRLKSHRLLAVATATVLSAPLLAVSPAHAADPVTINLIDINDFHGRIDANTVKFAGTIEKLRAEAGAANTLFLSAGDNIGASLFASATLKDKPTLDVLNVLDLKTSTVGNHEFDQGSSDLLGRVTADSDFSYLGANVVDKATGAPALKAFDTFSVSGLDVAVIGAVTEETPSLVSPAGIASLTFTDPVAAVNRTVDQLEASSNPPDVIVAAYHEGAGGGIVEKTTLEQETAKAGAFADIVTKTDAAVDAIYTGHTHKEYAWDAPIPGVAGKTRPIVQTGSYGERIGQIKLTVDSANGDVISYTAGNVARTTDADAVLVSTYPRVAEVKKIVDAALANAAAVGNQPVGTQTADITRAFTGTTENRAAESTLSNLVAEAYRDSAAKTPAGADIGINNPGGLRADLPFAKRTDADADGRILFGEALAVLTFNNGLSTVTLSGASLKKVLEEQWQTALPGAPAPSRPYLQLGLSKNMSYTFDAQRPQNDRITSITINGKRVTPTDSIKVAAPAFLTTGGDNFRSFAEGRSIDNGLIDYVAFNDYLAVKSPVSPDFSAHAVEVNGVKASYKPGSQVSVTLPKLDLTSSGSPKNAAVTATLTYGGTSVDAGTFPVTAGSSTVSFTLPADAVGDVTLTATASPSGTTVSIPLVVEKFTSTTTATTPARAKTGTTFTVEATVDGETDAVPTGTVTVKDGETVLATGPVTAGRASVEVNASTLSADQHALTVAYSGDATHAASTADAGTIDIVKGGSGFGAVAASGTYGRTSYVSVTADSEASGLVYVTQAGRRIGLGFLINGQGTVALDGTALTPGTYALEVFFNGDEKFDPTSTTASITIVKGSTSIGKASVSPKKIVRNRTKPFVTLPVRGAGFVVDGGKVTLRQGGKSYTGTVKAGKVRIRLGVFTTSGSAKKVTATYSGNGVAEGSSTSFTVKVLKKK